MKTPLKDYMDGKGLSVIEICKITGLAYMTVRNHMLGNRVPRLKEALTYEKFLGIKAESWIKDDVPQS